MGLLGLIAFGAAAQDLPAPGGEPPTDITANPIELSPDISAEVRVVIERWAATSQSVGMDWFTVAVEQKPGFISKVEFPEGPELGIGADLTEGTVLLKLTPSENGAQGLGELILSVTARDEGVTPNARRIIVPVGFGGTMDVRDGKTILDSASISVRSFDKSVKPKATIKEAGDEFKERWAFKDGRARKVADDYLSPEPEQGSGDIQDLVVDVVRRVAYALPDEIVVGKPYAVRVCASVDMAYVTGDERSLSGASSGPRSLTLYAFQNAKSSRHNEGLRPYGAPQKKEGKRWLKTEVPLDIPGPGQVKTTRAELTLQASPIDGFFEDRRRSQYDLLIKDGGDGEDKSQFTYVRGGQMSKAEETWFYYVTQGVFGMSESDNYDTVIADVTATEWQIKDAVVPHARTKERYYTRESRIRFDAPEQGVTGNRLRDPAFASGDDLCPPAGLVAGTRAPQNDDSGDAAPDEDPERVHFVVRLNRSLLLFDVDAGYDAPMGTGTEVRERVISVFRGETMEQALKRKGLLFSPRCTLGPSIGMVGRFTHTINNGSKVTIVAGPYLEARKANERTNRDGNSVTITGDGGGPSWTEWKRAQCGG